MPPVIVNPPLMPVKSYNKFKPGNFQKIDIEGKSQDIFQELTVISGHAKPFLSGIFGLFLKTQR